MSRKLSLISSFFYWRNSFIGEKWFYLGFSLFAERGRHVYVFNCFTQSTQVTGREEHAEEHAYVARSFDGDTYRRLVQQRIEIEFYLMRPQLAVSLETSVVQVSSLPIVLPIHCCQRVRVWPLKRDAALPQAALCFANGRTGGVLGSMVCGLRDEPRYVPTSLAACGLNDVLKHPAICFGGDFMFRRLV